jgi:hypothetical protein
MWDGLGEQVSTALCMDYIPVLDTTCLKSTLLDQPSRTTMRTITKFSPYEDTSPDARLIASANMTVLNRNESNAWTSDRRRIRFEVIDTSDT